MEHKLVQTKDYLLVVDEDVTNAKEGAWIVRSNIEPVLCDSHFFFDFKEPYRKVLAHLPLNNSPALEGVDLLPELPSTEDEVKKMAQNIHYDMAQQGLDANGCFNQYQGYIKGYNKAKETYKYTEDDIKAAYIKGGNDGAFYSALQEAEDWDALEEIDENEDKNFEEFIQSLQQPGLPVAFVREAEQNDCDGCNANKPIEQGYLHRMGEGTYPDYMTCQKSRYNRDKTVTNSQGQTVWVGYYR